MPEEVGAEAGVALPKAARDESLDRLAQELLAFVAEEPLDLAIDEDDLAAAVDHDHAVRRRLDRGAESGLGPLPSRDVHDRSQHEDPFACFDGVQSDLDGDLHAVLADAVQITAGPHRPRLWMSEKVRAQARVTTTDLLGHEQFDGLSEQRLSGIPEEPLDFAIDEQDRSMPIDHHDAAGR